MRTFTTLILALSTAVLAACVAQDDEPTADSTDGAQTSVVESNEIVAVPLCPDVKKKLILPPQSCWTPDGEGIRTCTDHITFHYVPVFSLPTGFPPVGSFECKLTGTDVTTTCTPCVRISFPSP